jgi:hypothetical protein
MNIKKYFSQIEFVGEVQSKRKDYLVFENPKYFVVISGKPKQGLEGNYNVVDRSDVFRFYEKFAGRNSVTMNEIKSKVKVGSSASKMIVYNIIYAMSALGLAKIDKRFKASRALYINFPKKV